MFHACCMDIFSTHPDLSFVHRPGGFFRGSWFCSADVLRAIPSQAFFNVPIDLRRVRGSILLQGNLHCDGFEDTSNATWQHRSLKGKFVFVRQLPNLRIIENTLTQFILGNLSNFLHGFAIAPGAKLEVTRLAGLHSKRVHSSVLYPNGFRTVTFKCSERLMTASCADGAQFMELVLTDL